MSPIGSSGEITHDSEMTFTMTLSALEEALAESATRHHRLCPRQVLGARIGLLAGLLLDLHLPQFEKRLIAIAETDGCVVDGLSAATGCHVGRRTLRIEDYGKVAVTFVDTRTEQAVRIKPCLNIRELAWDYAPTARSRWEAQLIGYQHIPDDFLFDWRQVELTVSVKQIVGHAGGRVICEGCGEEIINQRGIVCEGGVLCKSCAGVSYYRPLERRMNAQIFRAVPC